MQTPILSLRKTQALATQKTDYWAKGSDLYVYDEIGFWGVLAKDFVRDMAAIDGDEVNVHINSPGGSVFEAVAMYNAIRAEPRKVIAHIDGVAASAASYFALAADEVRIADNAHFMIHNPWTIAIGEAEDLRKEADTLDKINEKIIDIYVTKTGATRDEVAKAMDVETWYDGEEAVEFGLADTLVTDSGVSALFDLSIFQNVPRQVKRDVESALRDAGYSQSEAKRAVSSGFSALSHRDGDPTNHRDGDELQALAETLSANGWN